MGSPFSFFLVPIFCSPFSFIFSPVSFFLFQTICLICSFAHFRFSFSSFFKTFPFTVNPQTRWQHLTTQTSTTALLNGPTIKSGNWTRPLMDHSLGGRGRGFLTTPQHASNATATLLSETSSRSKPPAT